MKHISLNKRIVGFGGNQSKSSQNVANKSMDRLKEKKSETKQMH